METDSLVLVKILSRVWEIPWQIAAIVLVDIKQMAKICQVKLKHIFREGNSMVDCLAFNRAGKFSFTNVKELPATFKQILGVDKNNWGREYTLLHVRYKHRIKSSWRSEAI
ncbi:hypothetical protein MTR67_027130 [Solanum verrucosum]|uniref:RNase H type-1 domain-containing protein n=1 Tax=Solanum verrucosum TaxID=315347 RepID=A0AAF0TZG6_SOLVR|nr:hypothetical protein MTR67_027130 [Solanum verrucosum]